MMMRFAHPASPEARPAEGDAAVGHGRHRRPSLTGSVAILCLLALGACQTTDTPAPQTTATLDGAALDGAVATPARQETMPVEGVNTGDTVAPTHTQATQADSAPAVSDPLEPVNRIFYGVNWYVDHVFLRPVSYAYRDGVPEPAQKGVRNVLRNLKSPIILLNDALQGEWDRAGTTSMRFLINSTIGILGLFDVADGMGYPYHSEDFGQTLAIHGVGSGPYLVLPLFGPSNLRDGVGLAADWAADPFRIYGATQNPEWHPEALYVRTGLAAVDGQSRLLDSLEEIERSSIDTYAALRSMYTQRRAAAIRNAEDGPTDGTPSVEGSAFDFSE